MSGWWVIERTPVPLRLWQCSLWSWEAAIGSTVPDAIAPRTCCGTAAEQNPCVKLLGRRFEQAAISFAGSM